MRSRDVAAVLGALVTLALTLTLTTAGLAQASPDSTRAVGQRGSAPMPAIDGPGVCYQQLRRDAKDVIASQRFEPENAIYTSRAADDFTVARSCTVRSIDVDGAYYDHVGPADSEEIVIYGDGGGRPGAVLTRQTVVGTDTTGRGSFHLVLTRPRHLDAGTYWVAVRVNMSYAEGGQWGWEVLRDLHGTGSMWKNPADGFETGCTTYTDMRTCLGEFAVGPDLMFSVNKAT